MLFLGKELCLQRVHLRHCRDDCHDPAALAPLAVLLGRQHLCVSEHRAPCTVTGKAINPGARAHAEAMSMAIYAQAVKAKTP